MFRNTLTSYGTVAKFFHWTIFFLLMFNLVLGYFLSDFPSVYKPYSSNLHKSNGLIILCLMLLRLIWTLINPKPILLGLSLWQRFFERAVHWLFYVTIIGMSLVGWIGSSAANKAPHIFSLALRLPIPLDRTLVKLAFQIHGIFAIVLIILIVLHVFSAFYHYFVKRDQVLQRMLLD